MPKIQYRNTDVARKISHVTFGVESAESLQQNAYLQVLSKDLYNNADSERAPSAYGVLDRRLGTSQKDGVCATCNKGIKECIGHFGYIDLELPVFHVGYFGSILNILQTICKKCSRVLLDEELKHKYRMRVNALGGHYVLKKFLRKKVLLKAKKTSICPECHELNGTVRKVTASMKIGGTGFLKILHEKFKSKKDKDNVIQRQQNDFYNATEMNPELKKCITTGLVHILTPIEVLNLFELIPEEDVPLLVMDTTRAHPKDLILTRMPVPPVCIRPSVTSTFKSGTNEDDLSAKQAEIIKANDSIRACRTSNVSKYQEMWDVLQNCSAQYINSELSIPQTTMSNVPSKPGRGLVQRLKGKQGRFRGNLSGKRVDFSARTVISPDPNLEIDQVGIPMLVAKILTFPERVTRANLQLMKQLIINGPNVWPGANYLYRKTPPYKEFYLKYGNRQQLANDLRLGDVVERHLKDGDVVLFNRQPSLHKLSIMAHHVKVHQHRTFRFNESVCNPYNADFDGDEMNVHLPQTEEAKAEALILMANKSNLVTARNGELLIAPTQDFLTGSYLLTKKDTFLDHRHACQLACTLLAGDDINMAIDLPPPAIWKPRKLWTGKQIFSLIFRPNKHCPVKANLSAKGKAYTSKKEMCWKDSYVIIRNSELLAGTVDKSHLGSGGKANNIFYVILRDFGQEYAIKSMWRCGRLASNYLMNTGFSIGIIDVTPGAELVKAKKNLLKQGYKKCDELIMDLKNNRLTPQPGCTPEQTLENKVLSELSVIRDRAGEACIEQLDPTNSPLIMALSGSKGSIINISQMIACVGQQALNGKRVPNGFENRSLPHFVQGSKTPAAKGFVENSFYSGLLQTEFFFHTMGGREGLVDTAVKTAETGYMQRRLMKCLEDLVVHYDGTVRNAEGEVVQFVYGCDGLDPSFMEGKGCPVEFDRIFEHVRACYSYRDENDVSLELLEKYLNYLFDDSCKVTDMTEDKTWKPKTKRVFKKTVTNVNSEEENVSKSDKGLLNKLNDGDKKKIEECKSVLRECDVYFKNDMWKFMRSIMERKERVKKRYRNVKVATEIERLTFGQMCEFLKTCSQKYVRSIVEPGSAVGALAAQSIGEPGTQMTLKTFHFAGVAAMNITQGVPRIKEIMNASQKILTPVITVELDNTFDEGFARKVKARIEKTTLGEITNCIREIYVSNKVLLKIELNLTKIKLLKLEIDPDTVKCSLLTTSLKPKLVPEDIKVVDDSTLYITVPLDKINHKMNFTSLTLKDAICKVPVMGLKSINHVTLNRKMYNKKEGINLLVEGDNFREVLATYGVNGTRTVSNNIYQVYITLGIEAARTTIIKEINDVLVNHGMSVDYRHIMLLAAQMTHTGEVLGIQRHGLAKMKQSVFNLASFERTADHLFDAAYYGQVDKIAGVSENIIVGSPAPIGTGIFQLLQKIPTPEPPAPLKLLFDRQEFHS